MTQPRPIPSVFLEDTPYRATLQDRCFDKIDWTAGDEGCWEWQGVRQHHGHGVIGATASEGRTSNWMVHRLMYAWEYGDPWPLVLDHLCGNPPCVNPKHLQAVTPRENTLRSDAPPAINAQKDHCKKGHPLYGDNLWIQPGGSRAGKRHCKTCMAAQHGAWYDKQPRKTQARKGKRRTHCKYGHEATPENTLYRKNGRRECRVCHRLRERERQRRLRE